MTLADTGRGSTTLARWEGGQWSNKWLCEVVARLTERTQ